MRQLVGREVSVLASALRRERKAAEARIREAAGKQYGPTSTPEAVREALEYHDLVVGVEVALLGEGSG